MDSNFNGNEHNQVFASLVLVATVVSSLASLLLLLLVRSMRVWNGHMLLVTTMTLGQLVYDLSFFSGVLNVGSGALSIASNIAQLFSGVLVSVMSNWVAWVAFYVVFYKRRFDIFRFFPLMLGVALTPACADVLLFSLAVANDSTSNETFIALALLVVYNVVKLASIVLNLVLVSWTTLLVRKMRSRTAARSTAENSINALSHRLFLYPLVQMLSRSGCVWYEMQYGYSFSPETGMNFNPPHTSNMQFAAQCVMALSMPVASIGYLVIFVIMQRPKVLSRFPSLRATLDESQSSLISCDDGHEDDCIDSEDYSMSGTTVEDITTALFNAGA